MTGYDVRSLQETGSAHRSCQDRYRIIRDEDRLILICADGHGGKAYTRSGLGARFVCAAAAEILRANTPDAQVAGAIKARYDRMVAAHLARRPLEDWEWNRLGQRPPHVVYGTTMLAAVITRTGLAMYQLGDGDIHAIRCDGSFFPPMADDSGCQGNLTTSFANSADVVARHFRMQRYDEPAAALVMFSDGCEGGLTPAVTGLLDLPALQTHLEDTLDQTRHGDDQTLLVAYHPATVYAAPFQEALTATLEARHREEKRRKQELRHRAELIELRTYLSLAIRRAEQMEARGAPELAEFLERLAPCYERYNRLCQLLNISD